MWEKRDHSGKSLPKFPRAQGDVFELFALYNPQSKTHKIFNLQCYRKTEKLQILTFEKLEHEEIYHFCFKT